MLYPGVNGSIPEAGHLTTVLNTEVRNEWRYTTTPAISLYCRGMGQILLVLLSYLSLFNGLSPLRSAGRIGLVLGYSGQNFLT